MLRPDRCMTLQYNCREVRVETRQHLGDVRIFDDRKSLTCHLRIVA